MELVSIIVPIFNAEKTLKRCIDSILKQIHSNFELILVNDGSQDSSKEICLLYQQIDNRVHYFEKPNGGVSAARNFGISKAHGEWISFIDSDDYINDDYLSPVDEKSISSADIIITDCIYHYENSEKLYHNGKVFISEKELRSRLMNFYHKGVFLAPWSKIFRSKIIIDNNIRFDERIRWAEDRLFNFEVLSYSKSVAFTGGNSYIYIAPSKEDNILKYHTTISMVTDLRNKMRNVADRMNVHGIKDTYLSLWIFVEKIYLLDTNASEMDRRSFYRGYRGLISILHMISLRDWARPFVYMVSAFSSGMLHKLVVKKYLGI